MKGFNRRMFLAGGAAAVTTALINYRPRGSRAEADALPGTEDQIQEALGVLGQSTLRYPGSLPFPNLPPGTDTMPQIEHIVMLMMENHSYDNLLGTLSPTRANGIADGFTMSSAAVTSGDSWDPAGGWNPNGVLASNPNGVAGQWQWAYHMSTTCQHSGTPTQEWTASHEQYDNGQLDGFVTGTTFGASAPAGPVSMAYWNSSDLPVLYSLATAFPLADRWFQSLLGQTDPNRRYLIAGTSSGMTDDISLSTSGLTVGDLIQDATLAIPAAGTIFDLLTLFGISWVNFTDDSIESQTPNLYPVNDAVLNLVNVQSMASFAAACAAGTLPSFSFIDENYSTQSQENPQDMVVGEQFIYDVVTALAASPSWSKTMLILNYDEHGGYYDHVPPPVALAPDLIPPIVNIDQQVYDGFCRYGFRVPALVISPYSRPNWVTHTVYDHTSVLAMIERKWNLPALTFRDANANDLTDFLDMAALEAGQPQSFEAICPTLAQPAPSVCPANAPALPPEGSVQDQPA